MKFGRLLAKVAVIALATGASLTPAMAQREPGTYVLHTSPKGGCPGLDYHVTIGKNGSMVGFVAWDRMTHMARLNGTINKDGDFDMNAQEVGGSGRKAVIKGTASGDYITSTIQGSGTACDNKEFQVPRFAGSGLQGGGG